MATALYAAKQLAESRASSAVRRLRLDVVAHVHHSAMIATAKQEGSWCCEQDYRLLFEAIACVMTDGQIAEHT
ncbi:hypothetical protein ACFWU5_20870 [Nocardia sp. NPDC058640]|uniref:hypothetical protein n=1 Tax=Nocardia sp. NPDC058640 TaxID=3346571 RepID=UPI0036499E24